jgi:hypothetical protein
MAATTSSIAASRKAGLWPVGLIRSANGTGTYTYPDAASFILSGSEFAAFLHTEPSTEVGGVVGRALVHETFSCLDIDPGGAA